MMRMHVSVNGLLWFALLTAAALLSSSSSMTNCQAFSFVPATRVVAPAQGRRGGRSRSSSPTVNQKQSSPIKVEKVTPQKKKPTKFGGGGVLPPKGTRAVVGKTKQESSIKPKKTFGGSFSFVAPTLGKPKRSPIKVKTGTPEKNKKQTKPQLGVGRQPKGTRAIVVANNKKQAPTKNKGRSAVTLKTKPITKAVGAKKKKESPIKKNTKLTLPVLGLTKKNKKQLVAPPKKKKKKKLGTAGMVRATQRTKLQGTQTNKAASLTTRPVSRRDLTVSAALAAAVAVFTITPKSSTKEKTTLATTKKKPPAASKTTLATKTKTTPASTTIATGRPATGKVPDITKKYATRSYAPVEELPIRFKARSDLDEVSFVTFQAKLQTQEVEEVNIYRTDGNVGYATVRKVAPDTNGDASDGVLDGYKREQFRIEKVDPLGPGLPYKLMIATKQAGVPYNLL